MNLASNVFELAGSFMKKPQWVTVNNTAIFDTAQIMKNQGKVKWIPPNVENVFKAIMCEFIGCSINYCYFYGKGDIRPNGTNSTLMGDLLYSSFETFNNVSYMSRVDFDTCMMNFKNALILHRFPLIEERLKHLDELCTTKMFDLCVDIETNHEKLSLNDFALMIVTTFPGFASDLFLKRLYLFFIQLNRRFGWFEKDLHFTPTPADYQIPKMLHYFNCIEYNEQLESIIQHDQLIPKHSLKECEIRAATIIAVKKLCELTGWNVAEVDTWFFSQRHMCKDKIHLCITTDY